MTTTTTVCRACLDHPVHDTTVCQPLGLTHEQRAVWPEVIKEAAVAAGLIKEDPK